MLNLALKMLIGNRASCIGVIFGIFLATLLISQQSAIFLGLISRSYRMVTDIHAPNIWIMDPVTESDEKVRGLPEGYLYIVRSIPGVLWAVPMGITYLPLTTHAGTFDVCKLYGIDDATLIGAPMEMIEGRVSDLRREGAVIVDIYSAQSSLATTLPDGTQVPLKVGDELEINNKYAIVVGICKITRGFYPQPIIFTSYSQFNLFNPSKNMAFILAHTIPEANVEEVCKRINFHEGFNALTRKQFLSLIVESFLKTGILINFGISVALGVIIGLSITGQIFYTLTLENLMYYALIQALGGTFRMILKMITFQALLVGFIGFSIGMGATILWGIATKDTTLAFMFNWEMVVITGAIVLMICIVTAGLSIRKAYGADPKELMGNL